MVSDRRAVTARALATLAVCAVGLTACGTSPPPVVRPTEVELPEGVTVRPAGPADDAYPSPALPARTDTFGQAAEALARRAAARAKGAAPTLDGRLSAAADTLAAVVAEGRPPPLPAVAFAQSHHGLLAPIPVALAAQGPAEASPAELLAPLTPVLADAMRRTGANRLGIGVQRRADGVAAVVLLQTRLATLSKLLPRSLPADGEAALEGEVAEGLGQATVHVTDAAGHAWQPAAEVAGRRFKATFGCRGVGVHRVEVMAEGQAGPVVVINVPVWCGETPPTALTLAADTRGERDPARAEQALLALANAERATHGLPPLTWDPRLAEVARAHSADMARHGYVAHKSPSSGHPGDRVRAAGLQAEGVMENLGLGPDAQAVHAGLMASPAHRSAILSRVMQRVGVGVVSAPDKLGQPQLYATEVFLQPLAQLDAARGKARLVDAAAAAGLEPNPQLDLAAQAAAERLAAEGLDAQTVNAYVVTRLKSGPRPPLRSLRTLVGQGRKPETLAKGVDGDLSGVGVAVCRDEADVPRYCAVLLVGTSPKPER